VAQLGFSRILTSGGAQTAVAGAANIADIVQELGQSCIVMPGGGITEENLEEIQTRTRCVEFHASARVRKDSLVEWRNPACSLGTHSSEYSTMVTSTEKVAKLVKIYKVTFFK